MTLGTTAAGIAVPQNAVKTRLGLVLVAHTVVDVYSAFVPPLLGMLEVRCELTPAQTAWLLGLGSVSSGVSQPVAAWLSDRIDSRLFGPIGLLLAAICLSSIGLATSMTSLSVVYVLGMIGVGIFHPVGASSMGQLAASLPGSRRSLGVSLFFVAGMVGGITGSLMAPRIAAQPGGFDWLRYAMIPGLLVAALLHLAIARVPHRDHQVPVRAAGETGRRWRMVALLYCSNAMRFTVNMTLFYLFVRWAQAAVRKSGAVVEAQIATAAAPINGNLVALVVLGMAVGGLVAGGTIRPGREKVPLILVPICFAPAVALFGRASVPVGYFLAVAAGIGFAAMIPVTISLSQRLLPNRTSLASGLMLGGAWSLAIVGPAAAEFCLHTLEFTLETTFQLTAALLALSGVVCVFLSGDGLRNQASQ